MPVRLPLRDPVPVLNPAEILQAKALNVIDKEEGLNLLQRYLRETFPEKKIRDMIKKLAEAKDVKFSPQAGFYETTNWQAVDKAIDKVLKILNISSTLEAKTPQPPTKVVFNTVVYSNQKIERGNKSEQGRRHGS